MLKALSLSLLLLLTPYVIIISNPAADAKKPSNLPLFAADAELVQYLTYALWHKFDESQPAPSKEALEKAITGYMNLLGENLIEEGKPLTIIDFTKPSTTERMWILDVQNESILYQSLVAHGRNSGEVFAENFSNRHSSYMSSLGFYLTGETYSGKHGYSLRLDGLEKGINDQARARAIVIHGADYVNRTFIANTGRLGRSQGCPALPMDSHKEIIDLIKEKSVLFIFSDDANYLTQSTLVGLLG